MEEHTCNSYSLWVVACLVRQCSLPMGEHSCWQPFICGMVVVDSRAVIPSTALVGRIVWRSTPTWLWSKLIGHQASSRYSCCAMIHSILNHPQSCWLSMSVHREYRVQISFDKPWCCYEMATSIKTIDKISLFRKTKRGKREIRVTNYHPCFDMLSLYTNIVSICIYVIYVGLFTAECTL